MATTIDLNSFVNLSTDLVQHGILAIGRAQQTLKKVDQVVQQKSNELIKIGIKKSQELPEILLNQMEKDDYSAYAIVNPNDTFLSKMRRNTSSFRERIQGAYL